MLLVDWLEQNQVAQNAFAVAINKDFSYVCKLLQFKLIPSLPVAVLIAKVTGGKVRPEDLLSERGFAEFMKEQGIDVEPSTLNAILKNDGSKVKKNLNVSQVRGQSRDAKPSDRPAKIQHPRERGCKI